LERSGQYGNRQSKFQISTPQQHFHDHAAAAAAAAASTPIIIMHPPRPTNQVNKSNSRPLMIKVGSPQAGQQQARHLLFFTYLFLPSTL
jgi:hypothetical protein